MTEEKLDLSLVEESTWCSTPAWVKREAEKNGYGGLGEIVWWQLSQVLREGREMAEKVEKEYVFSRNRADG